jgi:hypothetical protein
MTGSIGLRGATVATLSRLALGAVLLVDGFDADFLAGEEVLDLASVPRHFGKLEQP